MNKIISNNNKGIWKRKKEVTEYTLGLGGESVKFTQVSQEHAKLWVKYIPR